LVKCDRNQCVDRWRDGKKKGNVTRSAFQRTEEINEKNGNGQKKRKGGNGTIRGKENRLSKRVPGMCVPEPKGNVPSLTTIKRKEGAQRRNNRGSGGD